MKNPADCLHLRMKVLSRDPIVVGCPDCGEPLKNITPGKKGLLNG